MAKHVNEWRPDTCGCVIEFFFDDELEPDVMTQTWESTKNTCPVHVAITDGVTLYAAVLEENQRKNVALGIVKTLATVDRDALQDAHSWSFDDSSPRVLTLSFGRRLPADELVGVRTATDLQFGTGLVVIER